MAERDKWQLVACAVAAAALVLMAARVLAPGDGGRERGPAVRVAGPAARPERTQGTLYVHVAGEVRRPGLLRVERGARVAAALERAGGPSRRADLTAVNLAAALQDGQQVVVPRRGASPGASPATGAPEAPGGVAAAAGAAGTISLATATVEQLDTLDGIGPTLAQRIVEHRERAGGFRSLAQLRDVDGIGEKRFQALSAALRP